MKKMIPVIIAVVLILIIGAVAFGGKLIEKYSYGKEYADLDDYYGKEYADLDDYYGLENGAVGDADGELAIVLQDELIEARAAVIGGRVYFDYDLVQAYFNNGFYADGNEQKLLYTSATDTVQAAFGGSSYSDKDGEHSVDYAVCLLQGDKLYVAADYVKMFANFSYEKFDRHLQVYTEWGIRKTSEISKKTMLRLQGGIKSPILRELKAGEKVELLEEMGSWSKVKTSDAMIGYVENKRLANMDTEVETPVTDWVPEEYTRVMLEGKVNLGWHAIYSVSGNESLDSVVAEGKGLNVIAPTWFSLKDSDGGVESFASAKYVEKAHGHGLKVWGVWDDFNYSANNGLPAVDTFSLFSSTTKRQEFARSIVSTAVGLGLDGVNLDFERLSEETRVHFTQFLREMSVLCRQSGLTLSVDISVPLNSNNAMRLDVQGQAADYVIMMGYDEHWGGCKNPGSVASIGFVSNGLDRVLEYVPAAQVINALPFYTREWKTEGGAVTDVAIPICNLKAYLERLNRDDEIVWDETVSQHYLEWQSGNATYQIWLEDADSLREKLNVMNARKIGGVAVWRLGYGTKEIWELVAAYAAMK